MQSVPFVSHTVCKDTVENKGMKAGATIILLVTVKKTVRRAGTGRLHGVDILLRTAHGASIPSSDEIDMVVIRIVEILRSPRFVFYFYDLPEM